MTTKQCFVFINNHGEYATAPYMASGHGPAREVIGWTKDINEAHVFPHENMVVRRFPELKHAQSLKAVVRRQVLLGWPLESEQSTPAPALAPNAPVIPAPAVKQPENAYPSHECMDAARRALGKGEYNVGSNIVRGDLHFIVECANKFGTGHWNEACRLVGLEK